MRFDAGDIKIIEGFDSKEDILIKEPIGSSG